jgi:branched-chain amino acid transport system ATP-binding protein
MLSLSKVRAGYGETVVLEDVDLELPERGSLALLGRNGVGKSTLLATIMGHTTFHSGQIRFQNSGIEAKPVYERCRIGIGYVPQERMIFPSLTVHENLDVARRRGKENERWTIDGVYDLFPRLRERKAAMGNQLSGGEQQMLAIGRALMLNPSLLLLDEPMEGLAPIIVLDLVRVIGELVAGAAMAVVIVEQHARLALSLTRRAIVLEKGRVAHAGDSAGLLRDPETLRRLVAVA